MVLYVHELSFNIPHLSTDWELHERRSPYTLSLYPDTELIAQAYRDIVEDKKWKKFAVLYDSDDGMAVYGRPPLFECVKSDLVDGVDYAKIYYYYSHVAVPCAVIHL